MGDSTMTPGIKLQWGPKEIEDLQAQVKYLQMVIDALNDNLDTTAEIIDHMKACIENAPCLAARLGELTYECRHDNLCHVCQWCNETTRVLRERWGIMEPR
jgi:hypothetical protein